MSYFETVNPVDCCGCKLCENVCSKHAITFSFDSEGFWYPTINNEKCISCNICRNLCPLSSIKLDTISDNGNAYAVFSNDQDVLENSTSGGVFTHISDYFLENNGVVYGHKYDDNMKCYCSKAISIEERNLFRGSKYVQSDMGYIYDDIKKEVKSGKLVLVTGTSCQIAAVKSLFYYKIPETLFLMDVVCHGVPSPQIFSEYISLLEKKKQKKIIDFEFRNKTNGWNSPSKKITYYDDKVFVENLNYDPYNNLFQIKDCILRPSCYECKFAGTERISDISIADFWGIQNKHEDMFNNNNGVSAVLINSKKGNELFKKIKRYLTVKNVPLLDIQEKNVPLCHPPFPYKNREEFFSFYKDYGLSKSIAKYCVKEIRIYKVKKFLKKLISQRFITELKNFTKR